MPGQEPQPDHYAVLGVQPTASTQQITSAYRRLVRALHPDTSPGDPAAPQNLADVLAAYDTLRDPKRRADYDAGRNRAARTSGSGRPVAVRVTRSRRAPSGTRSAARQPTPSAVRLLDMLEDLLRSAPRHGGPLRPPHLTWSVSFESSGFTARVLRWMRQMDSRL